MQRSPSVLSAAGPWKGGGGGCGGADAGPPGAGALGPAAPRSGAAASWPAPAAAAPLLLRLQGEDVEGHGRQRAAALAGCVRGAALAVIVAALAVLHCGFAAAKRLRRRLRRAGPPFQGDRGGARARAR
jgi:hypothetical protein